MTKILKIFILLQPQNECEKMEQWSLMNRGANASELLEEKTEV